MPGHKNNKNGCHLIHHNQDLQKILANRLPSRNLYAYLEQHHKTYEIFQKFRHKLHQCIIGILEKSNTVQFELSFRYRIDTLSTPIEWETILQSEHDLFGSEWEFDKIHRKEQLKILKNFFQSLTILEKQFVETETSHILPTPNLKFDRGTKLADSVITKIIKILKHYAGHPQLIVDAYTEYYEEDEFTCLQKKLPNEIIKFAKGDFNFCHISDHTHNNIYYENLLHLTLSSGINEQQKWDIINYLLKYNGKIFLPVILRHLSHEELKNLKSEFYNDWQFYFNKALVSGDFEMLETLKLIDFIQFKLYTFQSLNFDNTHELELIAEWLLKYPKRKSDISYDQYQRILVNFLHYAQKYPEYAAKIEILTLNSGSLEETYQGQLPEIYPKISELDYKYCYMAYKYNHIGFAWLLNEVDQNVADEVRYHIFMDSAMQLAKTVEFDSKYPQSDYKELTEADEALLLNINTQLEKHKRWHYFESHPEKVTAPMDVSRMLLQLDSLRDTFKSYQHNSDTLAKHVLAWLKDPNNLYDPDYAKIISWLTRNQPKEMGFKEEFLFEYFLDKLHTAGISYFIEKDQPNIKYLINIENQWLNLFNLALKDNNTTMLDLLVNLFPSKLNEFINNNNKILSFYQNAANLESQIWLLEKLYECDADKPHYDFDWLINKIKLVHACIRQRNLHLLLFLNSKKSITISNKDLELYLKNLVNDDDLVDNIVYDEKSFDQNKRLGQDKKYSIDKLSTDQLSKMVTQIRILWEITTTHQRQTILNNFSTYEREKLGLTKELTEKYYTIDELFKPLLSFDFDPFNPISEKLHKTLIHLSKECKYAYQHTLICENEQIYKIIHEMHDMFEVINDPKKNSYEKTAAINNFIAIKQFQSAPLSHKLIRTALCVAAWGIVFAAISVAIITLATVLASPIWAPTLLVTALISHNIIKSFIAASIIIAAVSTPNIFYFGNTNATKASNFVGNYVDVSLKYFGEKSDCIQSQLDKAVELSSSFFKTQRAEKPCKKLHFDEHLNINSNHVPLMDENENIEEDNFEHRVFYFN